MDASAGRRSRERSSVLGRGAACWGERRLASCTLFGRLHCVGIKYSVARHTSQLSVAFRHHTCCAGRLTLLLLCSYFVITVQHCTRLYCTERIGSSAVEARQGPVTTQHLHLAGGSCRAGPLPPLAAALPPPHALLSPPPFLYPISYLSSTALSPHLPSPLPFPPSYHLAPYSRVHLPVAAGCGPLVSLHGALRPPSRPPTSAPATPPPSPPPSLPGHPTALGALAAHRQWRPPRRLVAPPCRPPPGGAVAPRGAAAGAAAPTRWNRGAHCRPRLAGLGGRGGRAAAAQGGGRGVAAATAAAHPQRQPRCRGGGSGGRGSVSGVGSVYGSSCSGSCGSNGGNSCRGGGCGRVSGSSRGRAGGAGGCGCSCRCSRGGGGGCGWRHGDRRNDGKMGEGAGCERQWRWGRR